MATLPYIQLYIADYLADTMHLRAQEHGAYLLLLMNYWQTEKPLRDDDRQLAAISRTTIEEWKQIKPILADFFVIEEGKWFHKRIEEDLDCIKRKVEGNKKGGKARQEKLRKEKESNVSFSSLCTKNISNHSSCISINSAQRQLNVSSTSAQPQPKVSSTSAKEEEEEDKDKKKKKKQKEKKALSSTNARRDFFEKQNDKKLNKKLKSNTSTSEGFLKKENANAQLNKKNDSQPSKIAPSTIKNTDLEEIFEFWKKTMNHPKSCLDNKRKEIIKKSLILGYTKESLKDAIKGCKKSTFHRGQNESKKIYDRLDLILRDASHIDDFISIYEKEKRSKKCTIETCNKIATHEYNRQKVCDYHFKSLLRGKSKC